MDKEFHWENGKLKKEGCVTKGKAEGLWVYYYESGEKQSETNFKSDVRHGHTVHYWPNGQKKGEGDYLEGDLDGEWTAWYENGQKEREGRLQHGKEVGPWRMWDSTGNLVGEYEYLDGRLNGWTTLHDTTGVKEDRYYSNGELKSYERYTPEGFVSESEVLMSAEELPPFRKEYIAFVTPDSILKVHMEYPFEIKVPGIPYTTSTVSVTNATVMKGRGKQFILTPNGKGDTCVHLYISLSNGEKVQYGPACFGVINQ
jgi:hypothetical protein